MKNLAIINPSDLVAKEIKDQLAQLGISSQNLALLTTKEEEIGTLTDIGGAAAVVQQFTAEGIEETDFVFLCGPIEDCRAALEALPAQTTAIVLSADASSADEIGPYAIAGITSVEPGTTVLSPHPAVVQIALLLSSLRGLGVLRATASVVQPASFFGADALDELMDQTRKILAFHTPGGGEHFDRQMVFNLLPTDDEGQIEAQLIDVLTDLDGTPDTVPAQLIQGGIFHGVSVSLYLEMSNAVSGDEVCEALVAAPTIQVVEDLAPGPVDAASSERLLVSPPRLVAGRPAAYWLWSVMDNLTRGAAINAVQLAGISSPMAN